MSQRRYLSLSNFFSSVAFYFDLQGDYRIDDQPGFQCYFGAGLAQFFDVASFLWYAAVWRAKCACTLTVPALTVAACRWRVCEWPGRLSSASTSGRCW